MPYRIQYAPTPIHCAKGCIAPNRIIQVGDIQFAAFFIKDGQEVNVWRHLECVGEQPIGNIIKYTPFGKGLQGFAELTEADKEKVRVKFGVPSPVSPVSEEAYRPPQWRIDTPTTTADIKTSPKQESTRIPYSRRTNVDTDIDSVRNGSDSGTWMKAASGTLKLKREVYDSEIKIAQAEYTVAQAKLKLEKARKSVAETKFATERSKAAAELYEDEELVAELEIMELAILEADVKVSEAEVSMAGAGCKVENTRRDVLAKQWALEQEHYIHVAARK